MPSTMEALHLPQSHNRKGAGVLDEVVASTRSTVFASATGTGKSVSQSYILTQLAARFPDADAGRSGKRTIATVAERGRAIASI
jgi:hypothetical protein